MREEAWSSTQKAVFRPSLLEIGGTSWLHIFQNVFHTKDLHKSLYISKSPFPHPCNEGVNSCLPSELRGVWNVSPGARSPCFPCYSHSNVEFSSLTGRPQSLSGLKGRDPRLQNSEIHCPMEAVFKGSFHRSSLFQAQPGKAVASLLHQVAATFQLLQVPGCVDKYKMFR